MTNHQEIVVRRLPSGYFHVRGHGPCEWAQVLTWPCDEQSLRAGAFPQASELFIQAALAKLMKDEGKGK